MIPEGYDFSSFLPTIQAYHPPEDVWAGFGHDRGVRTYFWDYMSYGWAVGAHHIVEIGVRHGFTGMAMCYGAFLAQQDLADGCSQAQIIYHGFDSEVMVSGSCASARKNFELLPYVEVGIVKVDTQALDVLPREYNVGSLCLAHIDGDHSENGAYHDMELLWPRVRYRGMMVVDDATIIPQVSRAVERFSSVHHVTFDVVMNETGHAVFLKE